MRPLDVTFDGVALDHLWSITLDHLWPMRTGCLLDFVTGGVVIDGTDGLDAAGLMNGSALVAVLVAPHQQRRGIGTALVEALTPESIGAGGARYMWPGVPTNLPGASEFFRDAGWEEDYEAWDYTGELDQYRPPDLLPTPGVRFLPGSADRREEVVAFNAAHFPQWTDFFAALPIECHVIAVDDRDVVVGSLLLEGSGHGDPGPWQPLLGTRYATLGCVGIAPTRQGAGIGTALVVHGAERLRAAGADACHIGWLVRTAFYARAGFSPWRSYSMVVRPTGR